MYPFDYIDTLFLNFVAPTAQNGRKLH